jgi:hypothetical protein
VEAQLIRVPTGRHDYYPALYGGVSAIHLSPTASAMRPGGGAGEMERRFLAYTAPRGPASTTILQAHINGDRASIVP